jgi:hypothetical protein
MNRKKMCLGVLGAVLAIGVFSGPAQAQDVWSGKGTAVASNVNYYVASAKYRPARIEYLDATSTSATIPITFYSAGSSITVTQASAAGATNIWVTSPTSVTAGDVIVIRSIANDTYQRAKVVATNATVGIIITNDFTSATLNFALVSGDAIYKMTAGGTKVVGAANLNVSAPGGGIWNAEEGKPLLVDMANAVGTNTINIISGVYYDPRRRGF